MGSTRALLNTSGTLTDTYRYDAFGTLHTSTGSTTNVYRFTGQQFDPLTGNYSLRARYYAPNTGRFLSRDTWPIDHQNPIELNRYVYAANNPVLYTDPTGFLAMAESGMTTGMPSVTGVTQVLQFFGAINFAFIAKIATLLLLSFTVVNTANFAKNAQFVGYHGTSSNFRYSILKSIDVVNPHDRNFVGGQLGIGFYVSKDYDAAKYFADSAVKNKGGVPIVLPIYAEGFSNMKGHEVPRSKWWDPIQLMPLTTKYDYLTSPVSGFEHWRQTKFNPHVLGKQIVRALFGVK